MSTIPLTGALMIVVKSACLENLHLNAQLRGREGDRRQQHTSYVTSILIKPFSEPLCALDGELGHLERNDSS